MSGAAERRKPSAAAHPEQWKIFAAMDADGNGTLDFDELFFAPSHAMFPTSTPPADRTPNLHQPQPCPHLP